MCAAAAAGVLLQARRLRGWALGEVIPLAAPTLPASVARPPPT